jgi:hypothetical protein
MKPPLRQGFADGFRPLWRPAPADLVAARAAGASEAAIISRTLSLSSAEPTRAWAIPSTRGAVPSRRFSLGRLLAYYTQPGAVARSRPPRFRASGDGLPDAGAQDRDQHGCGPSALRRARPRRYAGGRVWRASGLVYFTEQAPLADYGEIERRLAGGGSRWLSRFHPAGRDLRRGRPVSGRLDRRRHALGRDGPRAIWRASISASSPTCNGERRGKRAPAVRNRVPYSQDFKASTPWCPPPWRCCWL